MALKDTHLSEETKRKISLANRGKIPWIKGKKGFFKHSEETRKKISETLKGCTPWNKGKTCPQISEAMKRHLSEKRKKKLSLLCQEEVVNKSACLCGCGKEIVVQHHHKYYGIPKYIRGHYNRGKKFSKEHNINLSNSLKGRVGVMTGRKFSEAHKRHISEGNKGQIPWCKGKHLTKEQTKNFHKPHKGYKLSEWARKERIGRNAGDKNVNWKGGISFEPYCSKFNRRLKEKIRNRDNRTCQLCGVKENSTKLCCHHIHYDKEDCEPDLIALCLRCNIKVNSNRDHYEALFMQKLKERGMI